MLYSFDIFDTIICRKTKHPHDIFKEVEQRALDLRDEISLQPNLLVDWAQKRIIAERIARERCHKDEITLDDIYFYLSRVLVTDMKSLLPLQRMELECEFENSLPIPAEIGKIKKLLQAGQRVVLISDMYLSEEQIRRILLKHDDIFNNIPIYVSSQFQATKSKGDLYEVVKQSEAASYNEWIHEGDSRHSDILVPEQFGIRTEYVKKEVSSTAILENTFAQKHLYEFEHLDRKKNMEDVGYYFGGPILLGYVEWILDACFRLGIKRLYFLSRDGYILKKIADILLQREGKEIKTFYLYSSRKAWRVEEKNQKGILRRYLLQEIPDQADKDYAFVDMQGTGISFDCIGQLMGVPLTAFYFAMLKGNPKTQNRYFVYQDRKYSKLYETLARAPHNAVCSFEENGNEIIPVFEERGLNGSQIEIINHYCDGVLNFVDGSNLKKELFSMSRALFQYMSAIKNCEIADLIGSIPFDSTNESENEFAPALSPEKAADCYFNRAAYSGTDFELSLARLDEKSKEEYMLAKQHKLKEYSDYLAQKRRAPNQKGIILYGAGIVGMQTFRKFYDNPSEGKILAWVDLNFAEKQKADFAVVSLKEALSSDLEYDLIVVAVKNGYEAVKKMLIANRINADQIVYYEDWDKFARK